MEFLGPDVEKVSMKIQLRTDHGINPESELGRLRKMRDTGAVFPFILGGAPVSDNYWLLEDIGADSYTHLRAHETRHDLVCRLMLEKKNTTEG